MKLSNIPWKLLLAGSLTCQVACTADGAETLQLLRNQLPADGCVVPIDSTGPFQPRGRIDVSSNQGYRFTPLVQNVAIANENSMRRIFVDGANVDIEFVGANAPDPASFQDNYINFRSPFSGSIAAEGLTSFDFDIVSRELLADLASAVTPTSSVQLIASVTIVGDLDGDTVESNTFSYPVEICDGCMRNVLGPCLGLSETLEISGGGACNSNQDGILDCCTAGDGSLTCPAVPIAIDPV